MRITKFKRIDNKQIPKDKKEIRLFSIVRNESLRLPYFFKYYKKLGVDRFFILNNDSNDDTADICLSNKNTHVFSTKDSYLRANVGINWLYSLLDEFGVGNWCVIADADELFSYPLQYKISLRNLCNYLDNKKYTALNCLLLDMYSNKNVGEVGYKQGHNPLNYCSFFERGFLRKVPGKFVNPKNSKTFNFTRYMGGVRQRVFKGHYTCISKVPLVKYNKRVYISCGFHHMGNVRYPKMTGVVFHFKFMQDFFDKAKAITKLKYSKKKDSVNVWLLENKTYLKRQKEGINLFYKDSIKYKNQKQLIDLGMMNVSKDFIEFTENVSLVKV